MSPLSPPHPSPHSGHSGENSLVAPPVQAAVTVGKLAGVAVAAGKPASVVEKLVVRRLCKFYEEMVLLEKPHAMDEKWTVQVSVEWWVGSASVRNEQLVRNGGATGPPICPWMTGAPCTWVPCGAHGEVVLLGQSYALDDMSTMQLRSEP
ncbi:unnamed protein product [Closterium sp. Naga37s-1]|nr:unnamed protein product [Closterium sp. Naga37s-1]